MSEEREVIDSAVPEVIADEAALEEAYLADREVVIESIPEPKAPVHKVKRTIRGNRLLQFLAYVLLVGGSLLAAALTVASLYMYSYNMYTMPFQQFYSRMAYPMVYEKKVIIVEHLCSNRENELEDYLDNTNLQYIYYGEDDTLSHQFVETPPCDIYEYEFTVYESSQRMRLEIGIRQDFQFNDSFRIAYELAGVIYPNRYMIPVAALLSILLTIGMFYFLMCSAGYRNGKEGVTESPITLVHLEVVTIVYAAVMALGFIACEELVGRSLLGNIILITCFLTIGLLWTMGYLRELAIRVKLGILIKNTIVYWICSKAWKLLKKLGGILGGMLSFVPLVLKTIMVLIIICFFELLGLLLWGSNELMVLWVLEQIILIPLCIYVAILCKKLLQGTEALAEGKLAYKVNTEKMFGDFKEHGENLNQISQGIARAVEERTRSERMKTELITNVSHDIKTPLTSIINYADLVGNEPTENEKIKEYSEVLLRQSKRLKKLLDDLLEASKATTGTLECHFAPCEVGVLLTQAVGEYEHRFTEKNLELIMDRPEEDVTVVADGKHMWRVFDNLLNNICKYSQENSRVYLSLQKSEHTAEIIFRNMSKYALNVSAEELEERFVRGDKSRNMEGNGLGLSIARSLVELQHGTMQIITDGDLFKVILRFDLMKEV